MSPTARKIAALLLLLFGVELWLTLGHGQYATAPRRWVMAALIVAASLPPVYQRFGRMLDRLRDPTPKTRAIAGLIVFVLATSFLIATAFDQHRALYPKYHDEEMYLLQARQMAHARLWMPQHPAADSFESFHIFVKPVYAAIYFPGTALLYVPAIWLHFPYWLMPALIAGACTPMLFRVVAELIDPVSGALAALMLLGLTQFRSLSVMMMSHTVMVLVGLTLIWAWLRWREQQSSSRWLWAATIGALGGLAAIIRPADAICYALPIAVAMLWTLRRSGWRTCAATIAVIVAAAAPFLLLQAIFNWGVTGSVLETPYRRYCDLFVPQTAFGFHRFDSAAHPQTTLPQRLIYYETFTVPATSMHDASHLSRTLTDDRLPMLIRFGLPSELLVILLPMSLLALRGGSARGVLLAIPAIFVAIYTPFAYLLPHYVVVIAPELIALVLLGMHALADAFPRQRAWLATLLTLSLIALALCGMPQFNRLIVDDPFRLPTMSFDHRLSSMVQAPAIVMYHYDPSDDPNGEPVYNNDVLWPDDAPIIRAHDREAEFNRRLLEYYAQHQPQRRVYRVDRARTADPDYRPEYLGLVSDLAAHPSAASAPSR